jgi:hypothetical protein
MEEEHVLVMHESGNHGVFIPKRAAESDMLHKALNSDFYLSYDKQFRKGLSDCASELDKLNFCKMELRKMILMKAGLKQGARVKGIDVLSIGIRAIDLIIAFTKEQIELYEFAISLEGSGASDRAKGALDLKPALLLLECLIELGPEKIDKLSGVEKSKIYSYVLGKSNASIRTLLTYKNSMKNVQKSNITRTKQNINKVNGILRSFNLPEICKEV